jgi:crotonobetaine/carnitine-CoA ligase
VIAVPDEVRGEEIKAYVVLADGHDCAGLPPTELAGFCAGKLAYFKVPRYWAYAQSLPMTPSERVAKGELRGDRQDLRVGSYDRTDDTWR